MGKIISQSNMNSPPFLFASALIDPPNLRIARQLGKIQASSLLRFLFNGEIVLWRNFPDPLFTVERRSLHEINFALGKPPRLVGDLEQITRGSRLRLAISLEEHVDRYSWIVLAHEDVIALRNWDHLFENIEGDILVSERKNGTLDAGFTAIRSDCYLQFVEAWRHWSGEGADSYECDFLREVIERAQLKAVHIERGEMVRPFEESCGVSEMMEAAVVHLAGGSAEEKLKLAFALHMMRIFGDKDGLVLDLLES